MNDFEGLGPMIVEADDVTLAALSATANSLVILRFAKADGGPSVHE